MIGTDAKVGLSKMPERDLEPRGAKGEAPMLADLPDFQSLLATSNEEKRVETEKEKAAMGGDMRIGENKTDKEFRESLEKITGKRQDKLKNKLEKDDYLNLMVTQLKYQDPTKPMDNQEMATQLASFNTVEQLMGVNKTLGEMKGAQNQADVGKLSPYLGRVVEVAGDKMSVRADRTATDMALKLPVQANTVSVQVKDGSGTVVRTVAMGSLAQGTHKVAFDGKNDKGSNLPVGNYTFSVDAQSVDGKPVEVSPLMSVKVDGLVDLAAGGKLETAIGSIDVKDIVAIRPADEKAGFASPAPSALPPPAASAPATATAGAATAPGLNAPTPAMPGATGAPVPGLPGLPAGMPPGISQALNSAATQAMKSATANPNVRKPTPASSNPAAKMPDARAAPETPRPETASAPTKPLAPKHRPGSETAVKAS